LKNSKELYLDFETTSFDPNVEALKPHHGHRIAGICITADEHKGAWYVPVRCTRGNWNLPVDNVMPWLKDIVESSDDWINHNVKFDAHFARYDGIGFNGRLVDTANLAKLIDSDRFNYGLKPLSLEWLEYDPGPSQDRVKQYLEQSKSKNYGDVPGDIIGEYGCQDVITNRMLYKHECRRKSDRVSGVWDTEIALTPVLFDMEVQGLRVDPTMLKIKEMQLLHKMISIEEKLSEELGFVMRPHTNADCQEALCTKFGLPVLAWTDDDGKGKNHNPSFNKYALTSYLAYPVVRRSEQLTRIVTMIRDYRKMNTLLTFFVRPYQEHQVDGVMHPDYNQTVRTGRMSCRRPNAQQLSTEAKTLILPFDDQDFISFDYEQVEFRLIVHYIQDAASIAAYEKDPNTDFHTWVAEMCGIPRKPAKNINFAIAFGGGKKKVVDMLSSNMELVGGLADKVDELIKAGECAESRRQEIFDLLRSRKGEKVFYEYHSVLPTLRTTTSEAGNRLKKRGFVFNAYGRERRLPERAAFRAFNTIVQSCAADIMKERLVALAPRYNSYIRDLGITINSCVHDEALLNVPKSVSNNMNVLRDIEGILTDTTQKFRVPFTVSCGRSDKNWMIASGDDGEIDLRKDIA